MEDEIADRVATADDLRSWGYGSLAPWQMDALRDAIRRALMWRVGRRISAEMTTGAVEQFTAYQDTGDEAAMRRTLQAHGGNYGPVIAEEVQFLRTLLHSLVEQV